jgi:menaquinone-dependent protoporphyrinogen oxidase
MKTAIIYISRRGTTVEIAHMIRATLIERDVELINLDEHPEPDLDMYEEVIIGGPIYMGDLPQKLRNYCKVHAEKLLSKRLGLFVCGMIPDRAKQQEELIRPIQKPCMKKHG